MKPRLLLGDCLELLPPLVATGERFDLIYVDPPYNAGGTRGARLTRGGRSEGPLAYSDDWGGIDAFLAMLRPRLAAMRDALSERGSLWTHLDHRAVHEVKIILDELFGRQRYQGEIIWVPGNGGRKRTGIPITHQTILVYSKTGDFVYDPDCEQLREPFAETSQRMHFQRTDGDGRRYRERTLGGKTYRYYADRGRRLGSVWSDVPSMRANTPLRHETTGYPTQKPEALLERIVLGASLPESNVLDPMSGSGTTAYVAARHGRKATAIDKSPVAIEVMERRFSGLERSAPNAPTPSKTPTAS